jgi:hypothetical protein
VTIIDTLTHPLFVALGIPVVFLICGGLCKSVIVRSLELEHFYLGLECALAAVSSAMIHVYDLCRKVPQSAAVPREILTQFQICAGFVVISLCLILVLLSVHQKFSPLPITAKTDAKLPQTPEWRRFVFLGIFSNLVGLGLMVGFILRVKNN